MGRRDLSTKEKKEALCKTCHKKDPDNKFHKEFKYDERWLKIQHGGKDFKPKAGGDSKGTASK